MGLNVGDIQALGELKKRDILGKHPAVLEVGAQQISNEVLRATEQLDALCALFDRGSFLEKTRLAPDASEYTDYAVEHQPENAPYTKELYEHLGFEYACLDVDDSPHHIRLDLNYDETPGYLAGRFDLVTNLGTTEHVANQLNAFKVIHDMTALGGVMLHHLPCQGFINHGLVNYPMKFFYMLARSNLYELVWLDFSSSEEYPLPDCILETLSQCGRKTPEAYQRMRIRNLGIQVVLRKKWNQPFVPPIDVATGTKTEDILLRQRYWTVFQPDAVDEWIRRQV